ncbi:MAG: glycosyltransferase [Clostridia bacterium]|nr:glycosyltransferase [Clostridia bacterium]
MNDEVSRPAGRRIKVTHILTDSNVGGAGNYLYYLLGASDREKFDFSVILPAGAKITEKIESLGIPVRHVECPCFADRSYAPRAEKELRRLINGENPDVVHTHASLTGRIAAAKSGVTVKIMTKHCSDMPPEYQTFFPIKQIARRQFRRTVDGAVATDEQARDALVACGMPREMITVIRNGAAPLCQIGEEEKDALRKSLGIPCGTFVVGSFSRLEPVKAHEILLRAAAVCMRFVSNIYFLIVGDGSRREELEALAVRYGISENVRFCGFVSDIAPYMSLCTVNVNTSVGTETSNLAISEGLSLGVIPVVSDFGGNPRSAAGCGLVYKDNDPALLADAVLSLCRDPEQVRFLSEAAKREFHSHRTADRMARETEKVYLNLLRQK